MSRKRIVWMALWVISAVAIAACTARSAKAPVASGDAQPATVKANTDLLKELPFDDQQDFEDAQRGFIATLPDLVITTADGKEAWNLAQYDFLKQKEAPPTVNPSLWRLAQLNLNNGLFQVVDRVYQIRGFDASNMTIIEGDTGLILIDPLVSLETSKAGLELYYQERGQRPVVAVIYTHSHLDHYAGVKGVISEAEVQAGKVQIIAPDRFLESAVSENVLAGMAMSRRAQYMFGMTLPRSVRGQVDIGVGKAISEGSYTLIPPTDTILKTGDTRTVDGVEMVFQLSPDTEAPAEMMIYFPQFKMFDSAELACATLHNVLTLRGAQARDAKQWAYYLNEALDLFGDKTEVIIAQHNWPHWGQENVVNFLKGQRDVYKFIHDQTLRLANLGYTMNEIAEMIELPKSLSQEWYLRGNYGTVSHDVKAVYQKYLGWYDSNPSNLNPLPPAETAKKAVEYMGGPEAVMVKARQDFEKGEYRWVAQVMNQVVFAYPDNVEARNLLADTLDQLGYQAESASWRNEYLTGAYELRNGADPGDGSGGSASPDSLKAMTMPMFFDYMGVRLNGPKAEGKRIVINWNFSDVGEQYLINLENSALTYLVNRQAAQPDATVTMTRATFDRIAIGETTFPKAILSGEIKIDGNSLKFLDLLGMMDTFKGGFNIVTP